MTVDTQEALRYLGIGDRAAPPEVLGLVEAQAGLLLARVRPHFTYRVFSLAREGGTPVLAEAGIALPGRTARLMLTECTRCAVLAARDMARAVVLDACGSAGVESVCGEAELAIGQRFPDAFLTDRFSPGYGDLPLSLQPGLCAALDTPRRLGLYVTESFLLNPAKSVTAIVGLADTPQMRRIRGCAFCSMSKTCTLRKGGKTCAP